MPSQRAEPDPNLVEVLFHRCLELTGGARNHLLSDLCGGDEALRARVEGLLRAADLEGADTLMDGGAVRMEGCAAPPDPALDLGRYRLVEKIGSGGMGVVYRAIRTDAEYEQEVAVKLAPWAAGDAATADRVRRERQILAGLQHPNIARLMDGGTAPDGTPYLVMELVNGVALNEWMAATNPDQREIARFFRVICDAVSCAHQNLVVHRDLKPSNILVIRRGGHSEPVVLDFGVATLLGEAAGKTGTRALTPEYASPEQFAGGPISTASDVYSLGVLLYEMLAGHLPYRATTGVLELAEAVCREEPRAPARAVDEDLSRIALMALRKEPRRRYASVDQLSQDLGRWLDGYPVMARADTHGYRLRKFVARNRLAAGAGLALAAAITAGIGATMHEAGIAARRFDDVRKLANSYLFEFHDAIRDVPGTLRARQLVARRGLEYLDAISRENTGNLGLKREVAEAYVRIGDVQGRVAFSNTGDRAGALSSYAKGVRVAEELLAGDATDTGAGIVAARGLSRMAAILALRGETARAAESAGHAVRILEPMAAQSAPVRDELPAIYAALADVEGNPNFQTPGHTERALELYRKALAGQQEVATEHPADWEKQLLVGTRYCQVAQMEQALNQGAAAVSDFRRCLGVAEEHFRRLPDNVEARRNVAVVSNNLGIALVQLLKRPDEARQYQTRAVQGFREIVRSDAANQQARLDLADGLFAMGNTIRRGDDARSALPYFDESVAVYLEVAKMGNGGTPAGLRTAYQLRTDAQLDVEDFAGAREGIRRQLAIDDEILRRSPANPGAQRNQAIAWAQTGRMHTILAKTAGADARREWREALNWYGKARQVYLSQRQNGTFLPVYQAALDSVEQQMAQCRARVAQAGGGG